VAVRIEYAYQPDPVDDGEEEEEESMMDPQQQKWMDPDWFYWNFIRDDAENDPMTAAYNEWSGYGGDEMLRLSASQGPQRTKGKKGGSSKKGGSKKKPQVAGKGQSKKGKKAGKGGGNTSA
jgi:hypothetical protein